MPLMMAFSQQSEHARWVVNFILHKIEINLLNYSGEPMLIEETVDLLISLVNYREKYEVHLLFYQLNLNIFFIFIYICK